MELKKIKLELEKYLETKGIDNSTTKDIVNELNSSVKDALEVKKHELEEEIKEIKPDYGTSCFKITRKDKPISEF